MRSTGPTTSVSVVGEMRTQSCEDFVEGDFARDCDDNYECSNSETLEVIQCLARRD